MAARINIFQKNSGMMVDWEPLRLQWEQDNSITNWNYQAFIFEYNLQLFASNWHLTQHFEPRGWRQKQLNDAHTVFAVLGPAGSQYAEKLLNSWGYH